MVICVLTPIPHHIYTTYTCTHTHTSYTMHVHTTHTQNLTWQVAVLSQNKVCLQPPSPVGDRKYRIIMLQTLKKPYRVQKTICPWMCCCLGKLDSRDASRGEKAAFLCEPMSWQRAMSKRRSETDTHLQCRSVSRTPKWQASAPAELGRGISLAAEMRKGGNDALSRLPQTSHSF